MVRDYFSIASAEDILPSLGSLVRHAQELKRAIEGHQSAVVRHRITTDGESEEVMIGAEFYDAELHTLTEEFYEVVERIEATGAVLRDIDEGIVDFYTKFENRDVFLCWHAGERRIRHWHELDEGYAGRRRIIDMK